MKYGCIGEHLKHSFSKEIHNAIVDYEYEIKEIPKDEFNAFIVKKDFIAVNVTIPYKEAIIPHLYNIDEHAKLIGAVNTVVNRDGKLYGYNTDFYGMTKLLEHAGVCVKNKKVAILGTGGTSKTARAVVKALGAKEIVIVSRTANGEKIDYAELQSKHTDTDVIINTSPCGMYPNNYAIPVDVSLFNNLSGIIDAVYNPLRTPLVAEGLQRGIPSEGGLYMLVAQAIKACEIFTGKLLPENTLERTYQKIVRDKENVVLIGMPASGKTTVGKVVAKALGREFIDTDAVIESEGLKIADIFKKHGETVFRDMETQVVKQVTTHTGKVIATGGGTILRRENVDALRQNGKLFFIDRPLEKLIPTSDRPLSSDKQAIEKRYGERYEIYSSVCDVKMDAEGSVEQVANKIIGAFLE